MVAELDAALHNPVWTTYLGRKCCPPSRPVLEEPAADHPDLLGALVSVPWRRRLKADKPPRSRGLPPRLAADHIAAGGTPLIRMSGTTCPPAWSPPAHTAPLASCSGGRST